ncbi:hypothetical protein CTI14_63800, partial [Methylobacterium radiotolerans]
EEVVNRFCPGTFQALFISPWSFRKATMLPLNARRKNRSRTGGAGAAGDDQGAQQDGDQREEVVNRFCPGTFQALFISPWSFRKATMLPLNA